MRILMIVLNQIGRGTYWRAYYLAQALVKRGHTVTLMTTAVSPSQRFRSYVADGLQIVEAPDVFIPVIQAARTLQPSNPAVGVRMEQLPRTWLPDFLGGWDGISAVRRALWVHTQTFDIVHAFESRPSVLFPALMAQRRGARLVMDWCDWLSGAVDLRPNPVGRVVMKPLETFFEDRFRTRAQGTTVINSLLWQRAIRLGVPPDSMLLLRNGTAIDFPLLNQAAARRQTGLEQEKLLIGYVGRIAMQDAHLMAEALNRVRAVRPDVRLVLMGFNRRLEGLLDETSAVIRTEGQVSQAQMYIYLRACDLCWLPLVDNVYNRGRLPFKLTDYLTAGRPVVATRVGDLPEIIERYRCGVLTADNAADFADQTLALLDDPTRRMQLGQTARQVAETELSWDYLGAQLEKLYVRVVA